jgi:hypothetical protein
MIFAIAYVFQEQFFAAHGGIAAAELLLCDGRFVY